MFGWGIAKRRRRWLAMGLTLGVSSTLVTGCQSDDPPIPVAGSSVGRLYPGLPQMASPRPMLTTASNRDRVGSVSTTAAIGEPAAVRTADGVGGPGETTATALLQARQADPVAPGQPVSEETLDLGIALRLAGVGNPTVNLARERIREALAEQLGARSLLLPSINVGGNYHNHQGNLQASTGLIRNVDSQSLYLGFGSRTLAAESVAFPGVRLFAHLGDAAFEPLAARQRVSARRSDAQAVQNAILLDVATAYLELIGAEARREILRQGEREINEVVRLTTAYAKTGQGRPGDANRALGNAELLRQEIRRAEEEIAVASAHLCRLLNLDPSVLLRTPGGDVQPFRLIPEEGEPEPLVAQALVARPEIIARSAEVQEAQTRVRQERVRPWVPLVSIGYSGGIFGGGSNLVTTEFGPMKGRSDFDAFAVWNVQNLGFGNRAQVRRADAGLGASVAELSGTINQVRREVIEAIATARAASRQIEIARKSLATAEEGFSLEMERIKQAQGRPIEVLDSFRQLLDARQELLRAIVGFDVAQFRLFVAVGSSPLVSAAAVGRMPGPAVLPPAP